MPDEGSIWEKDRIRRMVLFSGIWVVEYQIYRAVQRWSNQRGYHTEWVAWQKRITDWRHWITWVKGATCLNVT